MTLYGLYLEDKLVYVGQTINKVEHRVQKHFGSARLGKCQNMPVVRAIKKYGSDSFSWKILETCKTQEELNELEVKWISNHKPRYNVQKGGKNSKLHESTKKQISERQKKRIICLEDEICFFSVIDAEAFYKAGKGTIGRVAKGKRPHYRGKTFKFLTKSQ